MFALNVDYDIIDNENIKISMVINEDIVININCNTIKYLYNINDLIKNNILEINKYTIIFNNSIIKIKSKDFYFESSFNYGDKDEYKQEFINVGKKLLYDNFKYINY